MPHPPPDRSPDVLTDWTLRFLDVLLDSASVDEIGVTNWWSRADAALCTAVAAAEEYGHAVTVGAKKLQIAVLSPSSANAAAQLGRELADPEAFAMWRGHVERDHVYLIALSRLRRKAAGVARKTAKAAAVAIETEPEF